MSSRQHNLISIKPPPQKVFEISPGKFPKSSYLLVIFFFFKLDYFNFPAVVLVVKETDI